MKTDTAIKQKAKVEKKSRDTNFSDKNRILSPHSETDNRFHTIKNENYIFFLV